MKEWAYINGRAFDDIIKVMSIELRNKAINYYNIPEPEKQEATTNKQ